LRGLSPLEHRPALFQEARDAFAVILGLHQTADALDRPAADLTRIAEGGGKDGMNVPPAVIDEDSELGRRYIAAMELAGRYSYAGREWVIERVRKIIGGSGLHPWNETR